MKGGTEVDLYQIMISHNRAWTIREMICFSVIFVIAAYISLRLVRKQKIVVSQAAAGLLLLLFLGLVFGSTVFTREPGLHHKYELELFWSWKAVYHGNRELLTENLLNMVLLLPAGLLLPVIVRRRLAWWKGLLAGMLVSFVIEICQLVFCRGLFEWDDIIHNGIGCMMGCVISGWLMKRRFHSA